MYELRTKRIYEGVSPEDGRRILVDRLWPRGIKKAQAELTAWGKEITPSTELRKLYHRGEMPFEGFAAAYLDELEASEAAHDFARQCRGWLEEGNVTLLYAAKNTEQNHVLVLRRWLLHAMEA